MAVRPQRLAPGAYLIYLDAWQRHLSSLEAPAIREVALGGPDTATRARTRRAGARAAAAGRESVRLELRFDRCRRGTRSSTRRSRVLAARAEPQLAAANLCEIAATAGYRRLENQLYRVEVHDGRREPDLQVVARERLGRVCGRQRQHRHARCSRRPCAWPRVAATPTSTSLCTTGVELIDDDAELDPARRCAASNT